MNKTVYWTKLACDGREWLAAASPEGLCYVGASLDAFNEWKRKRLSGCEVLQDQEQMGPFTTELAEYFNGQRTTFSLPLDLRGTPFQQAVWRALCEIPYGQTRAYADIAREVGRPEAVRAAGAAIGANPIWIVVPCHRVIGKNGALTGYRGGLDLKRRLLQLEGAFVQH
ncbi:methylated-DNA--[protein]-cysteine S-methyltransferase [Xylanibacillus composti]|uniref:Methylated-DNA--protein-cysteine methyltransferase n=1 Tax=Xylanibacillus composti TaxID=1572762 RepID=A0A8J4M2E1_9BACL|nr:methylated-DNA--[protein]-cysteine S-methyltransferase [Xylanibacillus composti]GIQ69035.1 methylated-DNA--protein-cysteine methyltransferase, inducible [Xylanibacillus composti]